MFQTSLLRRKVFSTDPPETDFTTIIVPMFSKRAK